MRKPLCFLLTFYREAVGGGFGEDEIFVLDEEKMEVFVRFPGLRQC